MTAPAFAERPALTLTEIHEQAEHLHTSLPPSPECALSGHATRLVYAFGDAGIAVGVHGAKREQLDAAQRASTALRTYIATLEAYVVEARR